MGLMLAACQSPAPSVFPSSILLIGDSFMAGVDEPLMGMASMAHPNENISVESVWNPATRLEGMWLNGTALKAIESGSWTTIILQEDLAMEGAANDTFFEFARLFHEANDNAGAETILTMPWEYRDGNTATIDAIAEAYSTLGKELDVKVAPVGLAWASSYNERPDFELYSGDGIHANLRGLYLTVSVLYATIYDTKPDGLSLWQALMEEESPESREFLSEEDVAFLDGIAWQALQDFMSRE